MITIGVSWATAEPASGSFDAGYFTKLIALVDAARAEGMQVVINVGNTPKWASDTAYWKYPPSGYKANVYYNFYPPSASGITEFGNFAAYLATQLQGKILGYECLNEPNMWTIIYPQKTAADPSLAIHTYEKMLKEFSAGVRGVGDPSNPLVIAGSTGPFGDNSKWRTSPQKFASALRAAGMATYFDAYSHHPYVPGGNANMSPTAIPFDPTHTVTLGNISTLLKMFPTKPFYLTEYAYSTSTTFMFGAGVSQARQASYLTKAYSLAGKYAQIQALTWYMLKDWSPLGTKYSMLGVYSGLRTVTGARKLAYYAFARGNKLTIIAPASLRKGTSGVVKGTLTSVPMGPLAGKLVSLQRWSSGAWRTVKSMKTGSLGTCRFAIGAKATAYYRIAWTGVTVSAKKRVLVN
jgi:hypothetical protein